MVPCLLPFEIRNDKVRDKHQGGHALNECADGNERVHRVPSASALIGLVGSQRDADLRLRGTIDAVGSEH